MKNIIRISFRNLLRSGRRTVLTASLITIGVMFVLVYASLSGSFKSYMVSQVTDSMLGHIQIHKKGYIASVDNLPLDKNLNEKQIQMITKLLDANPYVESYTFRLKLGSMFSNYVESTGIRLNGIDPKNESLTLPLFSSRLSGMDTASLKEGSILVPELIAKGMKVKKDDTVVLVATNQKGSVNGLNFKVAGTIEPISGPGGRDGYIHINDVKKLLRFKSVEVSEVSEVVIRLKDVANLEKAMKLLKPLTLVKNQNDKPVFEIHTWKKLSPFYNIVKMLDIMDISIKIILISIVLISILNVMVMSVYERIKEIGTIAAMGTTPATIIKLFLTEGLMLGVFGAIIGSIFSFIIVFVINAVGITFSFGRQDGLTLNPTLGIDEVLVVSVIVILISLIASISPAIKAAKLNPVDALRQN